jgi:hypothetical protein
MDLSFIFFEPVWLFRLPAVTLIVGVTLIWLFILDTNRKIANAKAEALKKAEAQKKA